jgi:hypothetical protein
MPEVLADFSRNFLFLLFRDYEVLASYCPVLIVSDEIHASRDVKHLVAGAQYHGWLVVRPVLQEFSCQSDSDGASIVVAPFELHQPHVSGLVEKLFGSQEHVMVRGWRCGKSRAWVGRLGGHAPYSTTMPRPAQYQLSGTSPQRTLNSLLPQ